KVGAGDRRQRFSRLDQGVLDLLASVDIVVHDDKTIRLAIRMTDRSAARMDPAVISVAMAQPILFVEMWCPALDVIVEAKYHGRTLLGMEQAPPIRDVCQRRIQVARHGLPAHRKVCSI